VRETDVIYGKCTGRSARIVPCSPCFFLSSPFSPSSFLSATRRWRCSFHEMRVRGFIFPAPCADDIISGTGFVRADTCSSRHRGPGPLAIFIPVRVFRTAAFTAASSSGSVLLLATRRSLAIETLLSRGGSVA